jgi:hypothetical protein
MSLPDMIPFFADTKPFLGVGDLPLSFIVAFSAQDSPFRL